MTAVIGILNKNGVAIAADSAVTRTRISRNYKKEITVKCTKNGNKMLRLLNNVPVSVMVTGNALFFYNPWDVVVRCYRRERNNSTFSSVEECVRDFFNYVCNNDQLWNDVFTQDWLETNAEQIFESVINNLSDDVKLRRADGSFLKPQALKKAIRKILLKERMSYLENDICPYFKDYSQERFHFIAGDILQKFFARLTDDIDIGYSQDILDAIEDDFELTLMTRLTTYYDTDSSTKLVFTGYGTEEEYPSLICATVCGGFDNKVNYIIRPQDIIHICNEVSVAIMPFAQTDVVKSILDGAHIDIFRHMSFGKMFVTEFSDIFDLDILNDDDYEFAEMLNEVKTSDLKKKIMTSKNLYFARNERQWQHLLENYDLKSMALLAESLIDLTGFHRVLTFQQEGVGGPVDVAVISKNDGFTWLNRKSWYHHKDVNGMYGNLGI